MEFEREYLKKRYKLFDIPNFDKHGVTKKGEVFTYPCLVHGGRWLKGHNNKKTGYTLVNLTNNQGKQNIQTGEYKDLQLLEFIPYDPTYNEKDLNERIEASTKQWSLLQDKDAWLQEIRGNN